MAHRGGHVWAYGSDDPRIAAGTAGTRRCGVWPVQRVRRNPFQAPRPEGGGRPGTLNQVRPSVCSSTRRGTKVNFRARSIERLSRWLKEGVSVETLALTVALGFVLGICPLFGVPTVLCGVAAVVLRLHFPALQLVNYLMYPLQILLVWPFAQLGKRLFGSAHGFWALTLDTTLAWVLFAAPAGVVAYVAVRRILARHRNREPLPFSSTGLSE